MEGPGGTYIMVKRKIAAFTLVELMIVVAIIALLAAIAIPNLARARKNARTKLCINNLRLITHAVAQYQFDKNLMDGETVSLTTDYDSDGFNDIIDTSAGSTAYIKKAIACPETNNAYPDAVTGSNATCPDTAAYPEHTL